MLKKILLLKIVVLVLLFNIYGAYASEDVEKLKRTIEALSDAEEKAMLHKQLGDLFVSRDNLKDAADEFVQALALSEKFPAQVRLQMAVYISWADRYDEALSEIDSILLDDPNYLEARIHRSRVLSWKGNFREAIEDADTVLREAPRNKDAMLVKANSLNWKGDFRAAMPLYMEILSRGEDFDARLGYTYTLIASGDEKAAKKSRSLLIPKYPYQEKELKKLDEALSRVTRPSVDIQYNHYNDSDDNIVNRYSLGYGFRINDWRLDLSYRHTHATSNSRDARADEIFLNIKPSLSGFFRMKGGIGLTQIENGSATNRGRWLLNADMNAFRGIVGINLSSDILTDTAELIENSIRATNVGLYLSQNLTDRLILYAGYDYKDYSDSNFSHNFQIAPRYTLVFGNPNISVGYRFRYSDFSRQSMSGYFDPDNFFSHQIFLPFYFEKGKWYVYLEPFAGHQSFKRYDEKTDEFFAGGYGTIGLNLYSRLYLEFNAEGGDYAGGTAAGFNYYLVGLRLRGII